MKILKGNLVSAPALGKLEIVEHGCLVLHDDGSIQSVEKAVPQNADAEVIDYGDSLIMPSFVDMHLHAPQYPMLGMGMDLPLIDWLNTYTFKTEARFEDSDYARRIYKKLASDLITSGTTRVCMFSSLHTDATLILMEELEKAGVTGYVGKVNMDRNGSPEPSGDDRAVQARNAALAGRVRALPDRQAHPDAALHPIVHRRADELARQARRGARAVRPIAPV